MKKFIKKITNAITNIIAKYEFRHNTNEHQNDMNALLDIMNAYHAKIENKCSDKNANIQQLIYWAPFDGAKYKIETRAI